jgi:valyl-tRNA synthetase
MSKTRGNVVDPLELIERHGADALRFTMAAMATPGSDLPLSEERMAGYRAFANKLWNAARFVQMNAPDLAQALPPLPQASDLALPDRWILSRLERLRRDVDTALGEFRFDDMANALYRFLWHEYCDWYLEMCKPALLPNAPPAEAARARAVLVHVLEVVLRLLHPVMPFLTEEIWQALPHAGETIARAPYPRPGEGSADAAAESSMEVVVDVVTRARNLRAEAGIEPGRRVPLLFRAHDETAGAVVRAQAALVASLARLESVTEGTVAGGGPAARAVAAGIDLALPLAGVIDLEAERTRLRRELDRLEREREGHARKLRNPDFLARARPEAVAKARGIDHELGKKIDRLKGTLATLGTGAP